MTISNRDPENIKGRLYKLVAICTTMMEAEYGSANPDNASVTIPQFINALKFLQSYTNGTIGEDEVEHAGSAVRKYARAFATKANGARGRKAAPRSAAAELDPDDATADE
jgi:hypothetical protein